HNGLASQQALKKLKKRCSCGRWVNPDLFLMFLLPFGEKVRMRGLFPVNPSPLPSPFMGRRNLLIALNFVRKGTEFS
ncbi:MAG: hypothetical protein AABY87_04910, partial [bacterium]